MDNSYWVWKKVLLFYEESNKSMLLSILKQSRGKRSVHVYVHVQAHMTASEIQIGHVFVFIRFLYSICSAF